MTKPKTKPAPKPNAKADKPEADTHAPARALPVVTGPLIVREHNGAPGAPRLVVTAAGLTVLEALAADGAPQSIGASTLGISISQFKKMLASEDDDANAPVMLAWQRGFAALEHEVSRHLLTAMRKGNVIAAIFFSKARLGWTETPPIQNQVGVQIVLPDSLSSEDYAKRIAERTAVTISTPEEPRRLIRRKAPLPGNDEGVVR